MKTKAEYRCAVYRSPVGPIWLLAGEKGLMALGLNVQFDEFKKRYQDRAPGQWETVNPDQGGVLKEATDVLQKYFHEGALLTSDLQLDLEGTSFQRKVWKALQHIPQGSTASYSEIARKIKSPGAARAVGTACGANPIPLFIPCHRVIGSNGSLCGFGGGLPIKKHLLALEAS